MQILEIQNWSDLWEKDVDLTEKGYKQALATAEFLVEIYPISVVYSSDLKCAYKIRGCGNNRKCLKRWRSVISL